MSSIKENTTIKKEFVPKDIAPFVSCDVLFIYLFFSFIRSEERRVGKECLE